MSYGEGWAGRLAVAEPDCRLAGFERCLCRFAALKPDACKLKSESGQHILSDRGDFSQAFTGNRAVGPIRTEILSMSWEKRISSLIFLDGCVNSSALGMAENMVWVLDQARLSGPGFSFPPNPFGAGPKKNLHLL